MNPSTHKYCKKCNSDYKHYGSSLTKCPRCEELKNELKGNEKKGNYIGNFKEKPFKITSIRAGKNKLRKLASEPLQVQKGIPKVSKKQASINATLAKIKAQMVNDNDSQCFTCPYAGDVDLSHLIPRSKRKDLVTEKRNLILQCRTCHEGFEDLNVFKIRKFKNLNYILETIQSLDQSRYIHVTEKLYNQLNYSK